MSDLNIRFSNCFNFINNTKRYLEANPTDWRNIYTEEALVRAECDLMEMELEALYDTEEYDALLNGNAFRTSKRTQRRKQNKKHHKADRYHGKNYLKRNNLQELSVKNAEFFHNKKAMDIAYDDGKWIYTGKDGNNFWSKVWYTRHKKNRNMREPMIAPAMIPRIMKNFLKDFGHVPAILPVCPLTRTR